MYKNYIYIYIQPGVCTNTGCIRKNCTVGSSVIISDSERLSSPEVYQMKADIRMQKCGIFYENPTETGLAIKGLTWGLQNGACADSLADAHAATLRAILRYRIQQ